MQIYFNPKYKMFYIFSDQGVVYEVAVWFWSVSG